jgi:hypothetical protein
MDVVAGGGAEGVGGVMADEKRAILDYFTEATCLRMDESRFFWGWMKRVGEKRGENMKKGKGKKPKPRC